MENSDGVGFLIGVLMVLAVIGLIIYILSLIAMALAAVAGIGGTVWGGGTAILNYGKSFKENMIDSNRAGSAV